MGLLYLLILVLAVEQCSENYKEEKYEATD